MYWQGMTVAALCLVFAACAEQEKKATLFEKLDPSYTNIHFSNDLSYDEHFNIYTYRNFYNGGGVAIGDINNDGLPDLFFTANMKENKLYLNKGNMQFEDITTKAGIGKKGKWSTGVSMADVNGDGQLDIYVCNSGDVKGDNRENSLYINNGNLTFTERAKEYGLDDHGLSTHAAFFDYDNDGDLDCYLLNNSFKAIGSFNLKENERNIRDSVGGDKLFRNDGSHFTDVSVQAGIYGSVIGFGLGVTVGDVNNDGWQDIYVSNDFFERDYLYINNADGTFTESLEKEMMSISNASMGADMADIDNDDNLDIFVTEMLPEDDASLKTKTTFESWDKYKLDLQYDYYHQFTRNMLQLNRGNNSFSEIGRMAGVCATDWSWGALITDLDNDGWKDIFVANGIYQDLTNEDYIQYISNESFFREVSSGKADYKKLIDLIPSHAIANYAFCNNGDLTFTNRAAEWGLSEPGFSNGAAYGDLDGDGDLDLVVNNVNMPSFIYRNNATALHPAHHFLQVTLRGRGKNPFAIGSRVAVHYGGTVAVQEQMPVRGFESTSDSHLLFGLGRAQAVDSVVVRWGSGEGTTVVRNVAPNSRLTLTCDSSSAVAAASASPPAAATLFTPAAAGSYGIGFQHHENDYTDFDRDRLLFQMLSTQGPRLAKGDVNGDGLEDLYVCGASGQSGALYVQQKSGQFITTNEALLQQDALSEDTDALFFDCDGDGDLDLFVCSGGSEFSPNSTALISRLYLNGGRGVFTRSAQVLPSAVRFESASCVRAADWDGDGDQDLFVGVRLTPRRYGYAAQSYLLENDGRGVFRDVTGRVAPPLLKAGMVTDAVWLDYDRDGKTDLAVTGEYMAVRLFHNEGRGRGLRETTEEMGLSHTSGWWNRLVAADLNGDGYPDLIGGNHGLNSRFRATEQKPVRLYAADWGGTGTVEGIVTGYNGDSAYPLVLRHDLVGVLPQLKKKYLKYESYRNQRIEDMFTAGELRGAVVLRAERMETSVLLSDGRGGYGVRALPREAQVAPVYGMAVGDYNGDGREDVLLGGNFFESKPEAGIYDAGCGLLLLGDGRGGMRAVRPAESGISIRGAVRDIINLASGKQKLVVVAINNEPIKILKVKPDTRAYKQNVIVAKEQPPRKQDF